MVPLLRVRDEANCASTTVHTKFCRRGRASMNTDIQPSAPAQKVEGITYSSDEKRNEYLKRVRFVYLSNRILHSLESPAGLRTFQGSFAILLDERHQLVK